MTKFTLTLEGYRATRSELQWLLSPPISKSRIDKTYGRPQTQNAFIEKGSL